MSPLRASKTVERALKTLVIIRASQTVERASKTAKRASKNGCNNEGCVKLVK